VLLKPLPLPPVLKVGNLNVSTIPGNAEIYLNGSDKGATPANSANGKLLAGLPVGQYELQLTKPGYHIAIIKVANNMTRMSGYSCRHSRDLYWSTQCFLYSPGATLYMNNSNKGTIPQFITGLPVGHIPVEPDPAGVLRI
jgi:hypothetical protein